MPTKPKSIHSVLALLAAGSTAGAADPVEWFSVSMPGQDALTRSDVGLLGQDESPSLLVDQVARGGSYTGVELVYQTDRAESGDRRWNRPSVGLEIETAVEALPGLVFGLDGLDHYPRSTSSAAEGAKWRLYDPQGGLRIGGGVDLLRTWRKSQDWHWVVAGWIPVFSQTRDWELRSGLTWSRKLRADVSWTESGPAIPGQWTTPIDSLVVEDTTWWRTDRSRLSFRLGGTPTAHIALQVWGGRRWLEDPGLHAKKPSWRTWGASDFAGAQASLTTGPVEWDLEVRGEAGSQSLHFDGSDRLSSLPDSGKNRSSVDFSGGSGRMLAKTNLTKIVSGEMELAGAWMDLERTASSGTPPRPVSAGSASWSSTQRLSGIVRLPVRTKWVEVAPFAGLQRRSQEGGWIPLWQGLAPRSTGRSWSVPLGLRLTRRGGMAGKASYMLSGEIQASGDAQPSPGLRHHLELQQGF